MSDDNKPFRAWCFTINYQNESELHLPDRSVSESLDHLLSQIEDALSNLPKIQLFCGQLERGQQGTLHLQLFARFSNAIRFTAIKNSPVLSRAHLEVSRGTDEQNCAYCSKCCDMCYTQWKTTKAPWSFDNRPADCFACARVAGPIFFGEIKTERQRTDLRRATEVLKDGGTIRDVCRQHPEVIVKYGRGIETFNKYMRLEQRLERPPFVVVIHGDSGFGKSFLVDQICQRLGWSAARVPPVTGNDIWFDGYDNHRYVIWDEFACGIKYHTFISFLNSTELLPIKGGHVRMLLDGIIITSMTAPSSWYPNVHSSERQAMLRRITFEYEVEGRSYGEHRIRYTEQNGGDNRWPIGHDLQFKSFDDQPAPVTLLAPIAPPAPVVPPPPPELIVYHPEMYPISEDESLTMPITATDESDFYIPPALQFGEDQLPEDFGWGNWRELPDNPFMDFEAPSDDEPELSPLNEDKMFDYYEHLH